jgi:hypothetical protein
MTDTDLDKLAATARIVATHLESVLDGKTPAVVLAALVYVAASQITRGSGFRHADGVENAELFCENLRTTVSEICLDGARSVQ